MAGLVDVDWVGDALNVDNETVHQLVNPRTRVNHGSLVWVWDVSPNRAEKCLWRFWKTEVNALKAARIGAAAELARVRNLERDAVIRQVIGTEREWLRSFDLARLLRVSDTTVLRLRLSGALPCVKVKTSVRYARSGLVEFLKGRLVE